MKTPSPQPATTAPAVRVYLRVSTDEQDTANQLHGVRLYADASGLVITEEHADTASGSMIWQKRLLAQVIEAGQPGDVLLVSEISRLARSTLQVLEILKAAAERGQVVHIVKSRLIMDGSISSKIIATVLGLAGEIEREFIVSRTTESLRRRKEQGLPMGRPPGPAARLKLDDSEKKIEGWLALGLGKSSISKMLGCSRGTLDAWLSRRKPPPAH